MGTSLLNWSQLRQRVWHLSPHLNRWQTILVERLRRRVPREPGLFWILSSGTQSVNSIKAIAHSEGAFLLAAEAANRHLQSGPNDCWMVAIPDYHVGGLAIYARAHLSGARVVKSSGKWSPLGLVKDLSQHKTTLASLVPTQIFDLVSAQLHSPSTLRAVVVGGGALDSRLYREARRLGWPLLPSYGLTEVGSQVATARLESLAQSEYPALHPLPHIDLELHDRRVFIRSPSVCRYVATLSRDGQATLESPLRHGYLPTEDLAEWSDGGVRPLGRRDGIVKVLGTLVALQDVEFELSEAFSRANHSVQMAVVAVPHLRDGERLHLWLQTSASLSVIDQTVTLYNRSAIGPRRVSSWGWMSQMPRTELGKIRRAELRALLLL